MEMLQNGKGNSGKTGSFLSNNKMAFLIDSNIIIYSFSDEYDYLRDLVVNENANVSEISRVEVLGYHGLNRKQIKYFEDVFSYVSILVPTGEIFEKAIEVRQKNNLKLGDSIIAATVLVYGLTLYTRNIKDFERVSGLVCVNPIR